MRSPRSIPDPHSLSNSATTRDAGCTGEPGSVLHDVVIVGAGPVGLFLACELRLFGVSVLVLERAVDPSSPLKRLPFGMRGLSVPTLEALYRRDLLDDVIAAQRAHDVAANAAAAHWMRQPRRSGGHFAGIPFHHDAIDATQWPYRVPNPADIPLAVALETFETVLARRAAALGCQIRRGVGVDGIATEDERVVVRAGAETFRARWLVGCDGGRSVVRKAAAFDFVGTDAELTGYSVDVDIDDPGKLRPGRNHTPTGMYTYAYPGTIAMVEFDGGACHRREPITLAHVQAVLRRVSGSDVRVTALRLATTWTDRAYQATAYRRGRVLLAGDAAHIHSPLGGQGLNLGLGDALDLGWKLAYTIRGLAPRNLLDSYHAERHAAGARILDWSRAQVALMRPTPATRALARIVRDLIETRDGATYFAGRVWGISPCRDTGDAHPLAGRSVPDFESVGGARVGALLRGGKGLLLDFDRGAMLPALARRWGDRLVAVPMASAVDFGLRAALVRPDGIVAWATDGEPDGDELARIVPLWFGKPLLD